MKEIPLQYDKYALVDLDDFLILAEHRWTAVQDHVGHWYAIRKVDGRVARMHRIILNAPPDKDVDHINGDTLDNRRENLRLADESQNSINRRNFPHSSKFKGVSWDNRVGKWSVRVHFHGINHHVGYFRVEEEAGRAYDKKALELHGEFAFLNFPDVARRAATAAKAVIIEQ